MSDDLIVRLQNATGPDRELDEQIALYCGWTKTIFEQPGQEGEVNWRDQEGRSADLPRYTSSIDAALTLVPKIFGGSLLIPFGTNSKFPLAMIWEGKSKSINIRAATPAIALCIVALKARMEND